MPVSDLGDDEDPAFVEAGYRNYLVYCDDSGLHGTTHYGFGSLWIPAEARGRLSGVINDLRAAHGFTMPDEIKWSKINRRNADLYVDLVREFFARDWIRFHALVVRKGYIDRVHHEGDYDLARRKHFAMLLTAKIKHFVAERPDRVFHVRVDELPSSYKRADEVAAKIVNATLKEQIGFPSLKTLLTRDSKKSFGIQLSDVLLGAVLSDVCGHELAEHKVRVRAEVARHLGWQDLKAGTFSKSWKFNIWHFWDPTAGEPREIRARPVNLLKSTP